MGYSEGRHGRRRRETRRAKTVESRERQNCDRWLAVMPGPPAFFRCHVPCPFAHAPSGPCNAHPARPHLSPIDLSTLLSPADDILAHRLQPSLGLHFSLLPVPNALQATLSSLARCRITERTGRTSESSEVSPLAPESRIPILRVFMRFFRALPTSGLVPTPNLRSSLLLSLAHNPACLFQVPFASPEPLRVSPRPPAVPSPYHPAPMPRLRFSRGHSRGRQVTPSHQC